MSRPFDEKRLNDLGRKIMDAMEEINLVLQFPENIVDVEFSDISISGTSIFGETTENELVFRLKYTNTDEVRDARLEHLNAVEEEVLKTLEQIRKKKES